VSELDAQEEVSRLKRYLPIAAAVAVVGLLAVVIGGAATSAQEGDGPVGSFLGKVAEKLGVSQDELETAIEEAKLETIDEAVAEGRLTEDQAARLRERVEEGGGLFPPSGFRGHHRGHGLLLDAAAAALDMPKEDLVEQLRDGGTFAEVAEARGLSAEEFTSALLDQVKSALDAKVAEEKLTQERADAIYDRIEGTIDDIVSGSGPGSWGPGHRRFRGGHLPRLLKKSGGILALTNSEGAAR
jgi:hypothetical protein